MKPGELYTMKGSIGNYYSYLKRIEKYPNKEDMFGYLIIELLEYLGHDKWRFRNVGTASVHFADHVTFESVDYILGAKIVEEYIKIGDASDSALYNKFKDNIRDDGELV